MSGMDLIAAERKRQIESEGWTPEHDDEHSSSEIILAAEAYCRVAEALNSGRKLPFISNLVNKLYWPWESWWFKPSEDPVRNLVKAGALIAAEIDRLERLRGQEVPT